VVEQEDAQSSEAARDNLMRMFLKNRDMLSGFVYSMVEDWDLVEETIQEVTVYLCGHWTEFKPGSNFGAWIRQIARMRCRELTWQRKRSARFKKQDIETVEHLIADEKWDGVTTSTQVNIRDLDQCLKRLPDSHRQLVEMYYLEGRTTQQIAEYMNTTSRAFYMTLCRIRKRMKLCLKQRLAESNA
jgi:RNA polymerase sigma-70 factor, ECF subfamily